MLGIGLGTAGTMLISLGLMALGALVCLKLMWSDGAVWLPVCGLSGLAGGWLGAKTAGRRALPVALLGAAGGWLLWLLVGLLGEGELVADCALKQLGAMALGGVLGGIFASRGKKMRK
jgi:hypothetical protein